VGTKEVKKVVIDTNVLVSSLLFGGVPGKLIPLWKSGHIRPLCSKGIIEEYLRVLAYPKFELTEKEIDYILYREILPWFHAITVEKGQPIVKNDPQDAIFIWCALEGKADALISGDSHLLGMKKSPVPVLSVSRFLKMMGRIQKINP
jgi:putative PIN family toxin of toxin-antitoxin system